MSKIRINVLARELEVKSREVIDKLHELGIAENITHSSSIEEDAAEQLRRYYRGEPITLRVSRPAAPVAKEPEPLAPQAAAAPAAPIVESKPAAEHVAAPAEQAPEQVEDADA